MLYDYLKKLSVVNVDWSLVQLDDGVCTIVPVIIADGKASGVVTVWSGETKF